MQIDELWIPVRDGVLLALYLDHEMKKECDSECLSTVKIHIWR